MHESTKSRIDNEQAKTVDEHFKAIIADETPVDPDYVKVTSDDLPDWYDENLFKRGQDYYLKNVLSFNVAYFIGLMSTFLVPSIAKVLIFTKQSSTPCAAYKRYVQTSCHIFRLHECDERESKSNFYKSLNTIRWKHAVASKRSRENNNLEGITQRDMVITQFGFVGYVLLKSQDLGFTNADADREAFNHFWRVIGYLLGIPNRLNLCRENEHETTLLCQKIMEKVMMENLEKSPAEFYFLTDTSVCGLRSADLSLDTDAFYKIFHELHGSTYKKEMSLYSNIIYAWKKHIFASFKYPVVGGVFRILWNKYVKCLLWLNEHYPLLAWINYGRKQSKLNLYPHAVI